MDSPLRLPRLRPDAPVTPASLIDAGAAPIPLTEYRPLPGTAAGTVRAGWRGASLHLAADLERRDPFTHSTADRQQLWRLGDCFEIFLKRLDADSYIEFHVTPAGHRLQLRFPSQRSRGEQSRSPEETIRDFLLPEPTFRAAAAVRPDRSGWTVAAEIDLAALGMAAGELAGERFAFSFCVCNFTRKPFYQASTSRLAVLDVHLHDQWRQLECAAD